MHSPALAFVSPPPEQHELVLLTMRACALAQSAVSHAIDGLINGSPAALLAVRNREEELDRLDREFDERLAPIIIQSTPQTARELLPA